mgnify:CR=1 FL=1
MIDLLGFLYGIAKDIKKGRQWAEEDKLVDTNWLAQSGLRAKAEAEGMTLRWSRADKVATRGLEGYEIVYEIDKSKRLRRRLVLRDGSILIGKRTRARPGGGAGAPATRH